MSFEIPTDDQTFVKVLAYGESGTGKTVFAGSFPKPCIIDAENGWKSIKAVHGFTPSIWKAKSKGDIVDAYQFLAAGDHDFQTVIIDSLTDLSKFLVNDVIARNPTRRRDSADIPAQMDWMESGRVMEKMVYLFRDLPMNVVFIAGARTFGEGDNASTLPNVAPSLASQLPHLVDVTLYTATTTGEDGTVQYVGQTVPSRGRAAKDRSNRLPRPFMQLGYAAIAEAFELSAAPDIEKPKKPTAAKAKRAAATQSAIEADAADSETQTSAATTGTDEQAASGDAAANLAQTFDAVEVVA